jgi:hypothetical protein
LDELRLDTICNSSFGEVLNLLNDLAYIDIRKDSEIETGPEGYQLHRINQYTLQYLLHSINQLSLENEILGEKSQIYKGKLGKQEETVKDQERKIMKLEKEIKELEECNEHEKYLLEQEKGRKDENDEKVAGLLDRLKEGMVTAESELPYVQEFKKSMLLAKSRVLNEGLE